MCMCTYTPIYIYTHTYIYIYINTEKENETKGKRNNLDFSTFSVPTGGRRRKRAVQDETDCWQEEISQAKKN